MAGPYNYDIVRYPCYNCQNRYPGCHGKCEDYHRADAARKANARKGDNTMAAYYRPKIVAVEHRKHMERRK